MRGLGFQSNCERMVSWMNNGASLRNPNRFIGVGGVKEKEQLAWKSSYMSIFGMTRIGSRQAVNSHFES